MDPTLRDTLRDAYRLIKAGDREAARALIEPALASDHVDAWWLAAHAAATADDQRRALYRVLQLKPDHMPARLMLDRLNNTPPVPLLPAKGPRRARPPRSSGHRWIWNIVLVVGLLSFSFAGLVLLSNLTGWLDEPIRDIGDMLGLESRPGGRGQLGRVEGGDPTAPYEIPVVQRQSIDPGDVAAGWLDTDEAHIWTFNGVRNAEVTVLLQFSIAGDTSNVLELRSMNGTRIAVGVGAPNSGTVTLTYPLPRTEPYTLVIIGRPNGPRGDYLIGVDLLR